MAGLRRVIAEVQKGLEQLQAELTAKSTEQSRLARELQQLEEARGSPLVLGGAGADLDGRDFLPLLPDER